MKTLPVFLAVLPALAARTALGACEMPSLVSSIPDGAAATEEELVAVQADITAYVAAMDDYIACQNEEMRIEGDGSAAYDEYLYLMTRRIEAARQEVDRVANEFNDQVEAFRAARESPIPPRP